MCVVCDMKELNKLHDGASVALVQALMEICLGLIDVVNRYRSGDGSPLDIRAAAMVDKANAVMRGTGEPPTVTTQTEPDPAALKSAIQAMFPGAEVVIGSPDEVQGIIERIASGKKTN